MMLKKIGVAVGCLFIVAACGGGGGKISKTDYLSGEMNVAIPIPTDWIKVPDKDLQNNTVDAWVDPLNMESGFSPTLSVVRETLSAEVTPLVYATVSLNKAAELIQGYELIDDDSKKIADQKTILHTFLADGEGEKLKFIQTYLVRGMTGYTVTMSMLEDVSKNDLNGYKKVITGIKEMNEEGEEVVEE